MRAYRISLEKWAKNLTASGSPARWNSKGNLVLYTAASRALACLENTVHRSGEGFTGLYKVMIISIPPRVKTTEIKLSDLPDNWHEFINYPYTQAIGDAWYKDKKTLVLKVPSAIVPQEFNYILNTHHPYFSKVKLLKTEDFIFDPRIKE